MEAIVDYCENNVIDVGSVKSIVNNSLKENIQVEATDLKMLKEKKGGVLPV